MSATAKALPVIRVSDIQHETVQERWLIEKLWGRGDVGIIGGPPKCGKSWLGLDMALSVASGTPALDHFRVAQPGPALVYLAEDALPLVRDRIESLCQHRGLDIRGLDLHAITSPTLRLDLESDQQRLNATVQELRPHIVLLDPLVRLHRLDENSASDISRLLGYLRGLQRTFDCAIVLVHHASKKHRAQPGQALRGSSDLHAFGDANAYLARKRDLLVLTLEQRAARPPEPMTLELRSRNDGSATHLAIVGNVPAKDQAETLNDRVSDLLARTAEPISRTAIRAALRVNNNRIGLALLDLERRGKAHRTPAGWETADQRSLPID